jgi:transposase
MFLRCNQRKKDGKVHRYWSIVENRRTSKGTVVQRQVLYLGEINSSQREAWRKTIEVLDAKSAKSQQMSLFPDDGEVPLGDDSVVQVKLGQLSIQRPRQYGGCWLADRLWKRLGLDEFWSSRLEPSRKGTSWLNVLKTLVSYTLLNGGSEWKLHRQWFDQSAMGDLLGEDFSLVQKDKLYRCLDKLAGHKEDLFKFLKKRWQRLFGASYDILLYDLTSTYFESDPPEDGKRKFGYSRDHRSDCVQVVIALIVTPEGFPLTFEVMPGNTTDCTTLETFLEKIEKMYGQANRMWIMDRGIPTEASLEKMRGKGVGYLVGTPKGRLTKLEASFLKKPWEQAREEVEVKLHREGDEFYVLVKSNKRVCKEQSMRRRRLKKYWKALKGIRNQKRLTHQSLLLKVGGVKKEAGRVAGLIKLRLPKHSEPINEHTFDFAVDKEKMKKWRRKEGKYLLRSNMLGSDPSAIWKQYLLLTEIEQAFKELKSDLAVRPVYHSKDERIEAHIFVAFQAYCLNVTLKNLLKNKAAGLTPKAVLEKLAEIQMVDVHIPTTDGRTIVLSRYTKPKEEHQLLLNTIGMSLPKQPNPRLLEEHEKIKEEKPEPSPLMRQFGFGLRKPQKKYSRQRRKRFLICSGDPPSTYHGFSRSYPIRPP